MYKDKHIRSRFEAEVQNRHLGPQRTWLPPWALEHLWQLARNRGENPAETASGLLLRALYPVKADRKRRLRRWRLERDGGKGKARRLAAKGIEVAA